MIGQINALSSDLTATRSGSGKSRIEDIKYIRTGGLDPLTAEPQHMHDELTSVAAELDRSPVPRECWYRGPRWWVGSLQPAVLLSPLQLRKPQRNAKLTGKFRVWRVKTRQKDGQAGVASPRTVSGLPDP